ncbi:MAG: Gfo/Idh/MocA family oxidoreductase [Phycisphaerales bacterium]
MRLRHAVVGLGFMGRTHVEAIQACARRGVSSTLAAVCDGDAQRLAGEAVAAGNMGTGGSTRLFDPALVRGYVDPAELLGDRDIDIVHICTWTDTHVDLAQRALAAGKHVIVEKPVAVRSSDVQRLADAAARSDRLCMPAMCMRFWPGWTWLRERIVDRSFGAVRSATFRRLGSAPAWNDFYRDESRSGGALFDLHVHDTDFVLWCFGRPTSVRSTGSSQHITTLYGFADGPAHVTAEGGWTLAPAPDSA